jgi:hypothetical protein
MIANHSTWKNFIANHHASAWLDNNIATVSSAFDPTKNADELIETALGVDPNIFLILPAETMQPTLVHHVSRAPKNALLPNDTDEFFCLLGWDQTATAIKVNPNSFFATIHDSDNRNIDAANRSRVRKVSTRRLKDAMTKEEFSRCPVDPANETIMVRKCIPLTPLIANLLLSVNPSDPHTMGFEFARMIFEMERDNTHRLHEWVSSQAASDMIDEILTWLFYAPQYPSLRMECAAAIPGSKVFKAAQEVHKAKLLIQAVSTNHGQIRAQVTEGTENQLLASNYRKKHSSDPRID